MLLTIQEAQQRAKASRTWIMDRVREGSIPVVRRGHRYVRIPEDGLVKFLESLASGSEHNAPAG
jgi:excisionase family DNA binding protein